MVTADSPAAPGEDGPGGPGPDDPGLSVDGPAPDGAYGEFEPEQPPLFDHEGRVRLSFSRIDTYRRCPLQFRYGYIDKLPGRPSPHLSFGSAVHEALERLYDRKLPDWPDEDELVSFLYDAWDSSGFVHRDRSEQLRFYRMGQRALRDYHRREHEDFEVPVGTEVWFELPVRDEALIVGSIDRVDRDEDGGLHVVDYKTGKVRDRGAVAGSLQLAIYALACEHLYGRLPETVCLDYVVAGVRIPVAVDEMDLDRVPEVAVRTARRIRAEEFDPTPNNLCPWCDYRDICPAWEAPPEHGAPQDAPRGGEPRGDDGTDGPGALGAATVELRRLRRRVARDVRRLRHLEEGVRRARHELDERGLHPVEEPDDPRQG